MKICEKKKKKKPRLTVIVFAKTFSALFFHNKVF